MQRGLMRDFLRQSVAAVLGIDPDKIDQDQPVNQLGLDSLMAIQLKNRIEADLQVSIPMVTFLQGATIEQLIGKALEQIAGDDSNGRCAAAQPPLQEFPSERHNGQSANAQRNGQPTAGLADRIDELSDEEVDAALRRLLADSGRDEGH